MLNEVLALTKLRINDRKGELTKGKDADIVIWSKHPFDYNTNIESVYIQGRNII